MDIQAIKLFLKQNKITYEQLSEKSGIPLNTLKNIFSGRTPTPRIDTMQAIERALGLDKEKSPPSELTESEQDWLKLFYELDENDQATLIGVVKALKSMTDEQRLFVMQAIRLATGKKTQ